MKRFVGRTLDKRYQVEKYLGESGRGATFKGYDLATERVVAVKLFVPTYTSPPEFSQIFKEWRETTAQLDHPSIVSVLDVNASQTGTPLYIVSEFVSGGNLRQNRAHMDLNERIQAIRQACLILDSVHQRDIFHNALKPENILLSSKTKQSTSDEVFISDLGLPPITGMGIKNLLALEPRFSQSALKRTLTYLSPEQAKDEPIDARSDIYALGVMLYELAVGQPPFDVDIVAHALRQHIEDRPTPPRNLKPDLPEQLEAIILKALAKEPANRYQSATALADALDAIPAASLPPIGAIKNDRRSTAAAARQTKNRSFPRIIRKKLASIESATRPPAETSSTQSSSKTSSASSAPPTPPATPPPTPPAAPPAAPPPSPPPLPSTPSEPDPIRVEYDLQGLLRVRPGSSCPFDFTVTNQTRREMEVHLSVGGIPSGWISDLPTRLTLKPNQSQKIEISITPPRSPESRADQYRFTIRVHSPAVASARVVISKPLTVEVYKEFSCELPAGKSKIKAGSLNRLMIRNQGNATETFLIRWQEASGKIRFRPNRVRTQIPPGDYKTLNFRALPNQSFSIGATPLIQDREDRPFSIIVSSGNKTETIQQEVFSRGLLPTRYGLLLIVLVFLFNCICFTGRFVISGPVIENVVLNPPAPKLNQPFSVSWIIGGNTWGAGVDLLLDSQKIKTDLDIDDEYFFMSGINRPHILTVQVTNLWGLSDAWDVPLGVPPPLVNLEVTPTIIGQGETVLIEWRVQDASSVTLTDSTGRAILSDPEKFVGTLQDQPPQSITYTLTAKTLSNPPQIVERRVAVEVRERLEPLAILMVEPQVVRVGQDQVITLTWVVDNAETARIEPVGPITPCTPNVDSDCVTQKRITAPNEDTTYTLTAKNSAYTSTASVEVLALEVADPFIEQFEIEPAIITRGVDEKITVRWHTDQAEIITIEPNIGLVGPFGQRDVDAPTVDTAYRLVAQNGPNVVEKTVNVKVREAPAPTIEFAANPSILEFGAGAASREPTLPVTLEWDVTNVDNGDQVVITRGGDVVESGILSGSTIDKIPAIPGPVTYVLTARNRHNQTTVAEIVVLVEQQ